MNTKKPSLVQVKAAVSTAGPALTPLSAAEEIKRAAANAARLAFGYPPVNAYLPNSLRGGK